MADRSVSARWRALSLILIGLVAGTLLLGTASAHIGTPNHLWKTHIKAKVTAFGDKRWVNHGERMWAVVGDDGSLIRSEGAVASSRALQGRYEVTFTRNVHACAYLTTIGEIGATGTEPPGEITVVGRAGNERGVWVTTHELSGAFGDRSFHLAVHC